MKLSRADIDKFLYCEARLLDDKLWDDWLQLYRPDADFWMPAWDDDASLTSNPKAEISLIYYPSRSGLEDRVFRIKTDRSSATSLPEPRTSHNLSNIELLSERGGIYEVRFNWITYSFRYKTTDVYFGTSFYTIDGTSSAPLIASKKIILKNDYIHHVIDVYHI
jgi:benzoate/toluate 1,2-dioxygenase beta subunit